MAAENSPDYHLTPQTRWERADVLRDCPPEVGDVDEYLRSQGWERLLTLGDPESSLSLDTWVRNRPDRSAEYLLAMNTSNLSSPYMTIDSFPDLMDLLGRWAPAVQAAAVTEALKQLEETNVGAYGLVEAIAARASFGAADGLLQLQRDAKAAKVARRAKRSDGS